VSEGEASGGKFLSFSVVWQCQWVNRKGVWPVQVGLQLQQFPDVYFLCSTAATAVACLSHCNSVCLSISLSVCMSHGWIS